MMALCRIAGPALVRDSATAAHLSGLGFAQSQVVGCPSLFLDRAPLALPARDDGLGDTVLISVRHPDLMSIPLSQRGRLAFDIRRIVDQFRTRSIPVRLLCHDFKDLEFAQSYPDVPLMYTEDPYRFLSWLRDCKLSITFRLHAFLCCMALGVPSIPLTYDERSMSSVETIGLKDWAVDFLRSKDLPAEIQERSENMVRLDRMRKAARPLSDDLHRALTHGIEQFAVRVEAARKDRLF
jgi:hypothetical protein